MSEKEMKDMVTPKLDAMVRLIEPKGNLLGFASITFNDSFVIDDFSIVQGKNGIFVGMPSRPDEGATNGYRETVKPITAEFRTQLNETIVGAYQQKVAQIQEQAKAHAGVAPSKPKLSEQLETGKQKAAEHNGALGSSTAKKEVAVAV